MNNPTTATDPVASTDGQVYFQDPAESTEFAPPGQINCPACDAVIDLNMGDGEAHDYICEACGAEFTAAPMDLYEHVPEDFQQLEAQARAQAASQIVIQQQKDTLESELREKRLRSRGRWVFVLGSLATLSMLSSLTLVIIKGSGTVDDTFAFLRYPALLFLIAFSLFFAAVTLALSSLLTLRRKKS